MDALALLTADHNRVRGLFERFSKAKGSDSTAEMAKLSALIFAELVVHTSIEEEIFYPWSRALTEEIDESVEEGLQEHHVVKVLMEECQAVEEGSEEWKAKMQVIIENVDHHAGEEEEELFVEVRKASNAEQLEEVGGRLEARKAELGAPTLADKADLSTEDLHRLATEQEIPGRSSMSKEELAATVAPETQ